MTIYHAKDFLGKEQAENAAELLFLLYIDNQLKLEGHDLHVSETPFSFPLTGSKMIWVEFHRRQEEGRLQGCRLVLPESEENYSTFHAQYLTKPEEADLNSLDTYFPMQNGVHEWTTSSIPDTSDKVHHFLLSALANHCVSWVVHGVQKPKMTGYVDVQSLNFLHEIYYIFRKTQWGKSNTSINFFKSLFSGAKPIPEKDLDFNLHFYDLLNKGHLKTLDFKEKYEKMNAEYQEGGIYCLWTRDKVSVSNPIGLIKHSRLIRIESIQPQGFTFSTLPVQMNYEDLVVRFLQQAPKVQYYFQDMLKVHNLESIETLNYSEVAVGGYIGEELLILERLSEDVSSHFLWDGKKFVETELTDQEMALYTLNQYGYSIDNKKFVEEYGLDPSWLEMVEGIDFSKMLKDLRNNALEELKPVFEHFQEVGNLMDILPNLYQELGGFSEGDSFNEDEECSNINNFEKNDWDMYNYPEDLEDFSEDWESKEELWEEYPSDEDVSERYTE